jgi:Uma2 family endonuclease
MDEGRLGHRLCRGCFSKSDYIHCEQKKCYVDGDEAMLVTANKKTYQDYEQLPEGAPYQLIDGELVMSPSPIFYHQRIVLELSTQLNTFVKKNGLGAVVTAPMDVYLADTEIYQPDIIFISNERKHIIEERIKGAPDLIVEVLSPSNAYYDLIHKKNVYETKGVREYWIVDPQEKSIEVFENTGQEFRSLAKAPQTGSVSSKVLKGFEVQLEKIF